MHRQPPPPKTRRATLCVVRVASHSNFTSLLVIPMHRGDSCIISNPISRLMRAKRDRRGTRRRSSILPPINGTTYELLQIQHRDTSFCK